MPQRLELGVELFERRLEAATVCPRTSASVPSADSESNHAAEENSKPGGDSERGEWMPPDLYLCVGRIVFNRVAPGRHGTASTPNALVEPLPMQAPHSP